jgi:hypothetical protein
MTIGGYFHIGYLAHLDSRGMAIGWGPRSGPRARGESVWRHHWTWEFPWWFSARAIKQRLWVARMKRKYPNG